MNLKLRNAPQRASPYGQAGRGGGGGLERGGKIFKTSGNGGSFLKCSKILRGVNSESCFNTCVAVLHGYNKLNEVWKSLIPLSTKEPGPAASLFIDPLFSF